MTSPLREEWAAAKILGMRFERCPDIDEHILIWPLDAAFHPRGNTLRVLSDDVQAIEDTLPKLILFAGDGGENSNFGDQAFQPRFLLG